MTSKQRAVLVDLNTKPYPVTSEAAELKKRLNGIIIPEIIETCEVAMISNGLDEYGTNYRLGTFTWNRLFTSLPLLLADNPVWHVRTSSNVLILSTNINGLVFNFHIPKVDPHNRIPTGGSSVKMAAKDPAQCLFLSDELRENYYASAPLFIGYDITPKNGLGTITINQLIHLGGNTLISETIATLYSSEDAQAIEVPAESVKPAKVTKTEVKIQKENTLTHKAKANE